MIAFILDFVLAHLISSKTNKVIVSLILCMVSGVLSSAIGALLTYVFLWALSVPDDFKGAFLRFLVGSFWHPIIVIVVWAFVRRKNTPKKPEE